MRDDIAQRLAESFETALNLADGTAMIHFMDGEQEDLAFSSRFACPVCGYSLSELEPRMFSFNNPAGACPTCDGLGVQQYFDPDKLISHPELSLAEGVIKGWDRRNIYYFTQLQALAKHYRFELETPWQELARHEREIILNGSGNEQIPFVYVGIAAAKSPGSMPLKACCPTCSAAIGKPNPTWCVMISPSISPCSRVPPAAARGCAKSRAMCTWMTTTLRISFTCRLATRGATLPSWPCRA